MTRNSKISARPISCLIRSVSHFRLWCIEQTVEVEAPAGQLCHVIASIGGANGWYYANWLWKLRGFLDKCLGGVGLRGRSHPNELEEGDAVDFWRVEEFLPGRLKLRGEMITWGQASLEFEVEPLGLLRSRLTQSAHYIPAGVAGWIYWISLYPVHTLIFKGMAGAISRAAEKNSHAPNAPCHSVKS